jgi:protein phosphatase
MTFRDRLEIFGLTDVGRVRDHNEDAIGSDADLGIVVLADGMGGHRGGEVASAITVNTVLETLADRLKSINSGAIDEETGYHPQSIAVHEAVIEANEAVFASSSENAQYQGMGTTVVVLLFHDQHMTVAHVGDSRLYRYRDGVLEQMTRDHSLMQELVDRGFYTDDQARNSTNKNLVTRAIGVDPTVEIDILEDAVQADDIYLLCSDGLTDMLEDDVIRNTINDNSDDLEKIASELIRQSNESGGNDNISAILARPGKPMATGNGLFSRFFGLSS